MCQTFYSGGLQRAANASPASDMVHYRNGNSKGRIGPPISGEKHGSFAPGFCIKKAQSIQDSRFDAKVLISAVRPEGAFHQWREVPPRELSIALVADERFGWVTNRIEAS